MSDAPPEGEVREEDMGPPVTELEDHEYPATEGFEDRVHRSIERRLLAGDLTRFGLMGPVAALLELFRALFESLGLGSTHQDEDGLP